MVFWQDCEKNYMEFKRNMKLLTLLCEKNVNAMKQASVGRQSDSLVAKKDGNLFSLSALSPLPSSPEFWSQFDQMVNQMLKMKDTIPLFDLYRSNDENFHSPVPDQEIGEVFRDISSQDASLIGCGLDNNLVPDAAADMTKMDGDGAKEDCEPVVNLNSQDDAVKDCNAFLCSSHVQGGNEEFETGPSSSVPLSDSSSIPFHSSSSLATHDSSFSIPHGISFIHNLFNFVNSFIYYFLR